MSETPKKPAQVEGRVADATDKNWVDRFCPPWSRPYLRLSRADRPAGTWLLLIPCWWGLFLAILGDPNGATWADAWYFIACAIGAFLMRGAGCTWNDISDRNIEGKVERTKSRPIPKQLRGHLPKQTFCFTTSERERKSETRTTHERRKKYK